MPRISKFFGIEIRMYFDDHAPPHFHALYGEFEILMAIGSLVILGRRLPTRALSLVKERAALHEEELSANWDRARRRLPLNPIPPLE